MGILGDLAGAGAGAAINYASLMADKKVLMKGASAQQKQAIEYFLPADGCKGILGKKVTVEEYDSMVDQMVKQINPMKRALDKIGLDESELKEIPPVTLVGYEDSKYSRSSSRGFRSNLYSVTHLFFSATQVYMYQIILNTMKNERKERTEEYFYKDITNFSTSSDTAEVINFVGCKQKPVKGSVETQKFSLIVPGDKFTCSTYGDIEQQVRAMKGKLREKKGV